MMSAVASATVGAGSASGKGLRLLTKLRSEMEKHALKGLIIPSSDAHNSEYVATKYQNRAYMTNFKGSAGTCLVTASEALLWTDGRYWLEASETMYPEWKLMKAGKVGEPTLEEWIVNNLTAQAPIGMNSDLSTLAGWERMSKEFKLVSTPDLVQAVRSEEADGNGEEAVNVITVHAPEFCGETVAAKLEKLQAGMLKYKADLVVLSALDEIAWLMNLRGNDVPYNPVFYSYAVVERDVPRVHLFVDQQKVSPAVRQAREDIVEFHAYEDFAAYIGTAAAGKLALVDENQNSKAVAELLTKSDAKLRRIKCGIVQTLKAKKSQRELEGFKASHVRDGAALTRYLAWLHEKIAVEGATLNEYDAAERLLQFRSVEEHFVQPSFPTISSTGPNGAVIHYSPSETGSAAISKTALYLVDSGAQYLDGTTDVTRTVTFTTPAEDEVEAYTLVLKGHIGINAAVWPKGTAGVRLDSFARQALWKYGLNYAHGTGHGVGYFLNVHEGPQSIGSRPTATDATVDKDMIVSNEPGYYKDGHYGIRIENLEYIVEKPTKYSADGFLTCEQLTLVPLCRELIDVALLTSEEREWVNNYHAKVAAALTPFLQKRGDECALAYLAKHTAPL